jgi:hypothetical protein
MTEHALDRRPRVAPSPASVAAAAGGVVLVAGAVTTGAAVQAIALLLALAAMTVIVVRPEVGVFVLTSTFFLSYPEAFTGSGYFTINNVVGLLLGGILAVRTLIDRRLPTVESPIVLALLGLWGVLLLNQLVADAAPPFASLKTLDLTEVRASDFVSKLAFVVFVVAFIRTRWQILVFGTSLVAFMLITAPNAILNVFEAWGAATSTNIERLRAAADFGIVAARNANRLAFLCVLAIAIIGCAMLRLRRPLLTVLGGVAIAGLVTTIFLSASRSGVINLLVVAAYFVTRLRLPMRRVLVGATATAALALFVAQLLPVDVIGPLSPEERFQRAVTIAARRSNIPEAYLGRITAFLTDGRGRDGVEASTQNRYELVTTGLQMAGDHPVMGVGLGNFRWRSIAEYGSRHASAMHNSYLLALVEGGVVLLGAYVVVFVVAFRLLATARRRATLRRDVGLGWLVEATQLMLVAFLIFSVFADCWHEAYLPFILALAAVLSRLYATPPDASPAR